MAFISEINKLGLVTVNFSETMAPEAAFNKTILAEYNARKETLKKGRSLQSTDDQIIIVGRRNNEFKNYTLINDGTVFIE